jgi:hypothetical protein
MLKLALLLGAGIAIGAGAIHGLHAATGAPVYTVYEANITDEASYTKALPPVEKWIKENHGTRVAGGFNKTKLVSGGPAVGNRYVIVRWDTEGDFTKAMDDGLKAWIEKNGNGARQVIAEGAEAK